jgi:hypothetical protein
MSRGPALLLAVVVFASRALFLPPTLEDIDSVNFALGLDDFDPRSHQPHPPGYPVYIALAKPVYAVVGDPARALSLASALGQAALVLPLAALFYFLASTRERAAIATLLALANPLLWFNGARPLSDSVGLLFIISAQALLLSGLTDPRRLILGSFAASLAAGVRLQAAFLTVPLWLYRLLVDSGARLRSILAIVMGGAIWFLPLLAWSGGPRAYSRAFSETIADAIPAEPLIVGFTLNRAARTLYHALVSPWSAAWLGAAVLVLAGVGFVAMLRQRPKALGVSLLCFAPYLLTHVLLQSVRELRYSLPYLPLFALLAAEGIGWLADRAPARGRRGIVWATAGALLIASALLTLPALSHYHRAPSPPYAALEAVRTEARPAEAFLLAGHYMFNRYLRLAPAELGVLEPKPRAELAGVKTYWAAGGEKPVLFLSHPDRTDLEMISSESRELLGRWEWSPELLRFLSGTRPTQAELIRIEKPAWYAGSGWMISDEAGSVAEVTAVAERTIFVAPLPGAAFVLVSGEPLSQEARDFELELSLGETILDRLALGQALLRGYSLPELPPPAAGSEGGYLRLIAETRRGGTPAGAPFLLAGFEYRSASRPGMVHGQGWYLPERDEQAVLFRWTSPRARSLLHVPPAGARLRIQGVAPLEYLGPEVELEITIDGKTRLSTALRQRPFELELPLAQDGKPFQEVAIACQRAFVPDDFQRNGDRRRLSLRIYRFEVS